MRSASEVLAVAAAKPHPTIALQFERMLSGQPQLGLPRYGKEPCVRDLIFAYYEKHFDETKSDALTKEYIAALAAIVGL